ncbi:MAG TPA: acyltransferase [Thermoanaerobaculia bacterium]|nr:acyltransferase [Thermoanaerobaculia bacterium]
MSIRADLGHDWFARPLPANVELGEGSWLYSSYAFLHYQSRRPVGLRVGHDTGLYNGTFFELGVDGEVRIGSYCTLVGVIVVTNGRVEIGDYAFLAHEVVIADHAIAQPPRSEWPRGEVGASATSIHLGENVWVGARATILGGTVVGNHAVIGAGAVVQGSYPERCVLAGNPAQLVRRF